jgi:hypothetical protein
MRDIFGRVTEGFLVQISREFYVGLCDANQDFLCIYQVIIILTETNITTALLKKRSLHQKNRG